MNNHQQDLISQNLQNIQALLITKNKFQEAYEDVEINGLPQEALFDGDSKTSHQLDSLRIITMCNELIFELVREINNK